MPATREVIGLAHGLTGTKNAEWIIHINNMHMLDSFSAKLPNHGNRDSHVNTFPLFQQSLEKAGIAARDNLPPLARPSIV